MLALPWERVARESGSRTLTRGKRGSDPLAADSRSQRSGSVATKRWSDLSPRTRRLVLILKTAALVDLARRPSEEVRGSKRLWAAAIVLINSVGAVPIAYFAYGRKLSQS